MKNILTKDIDIHHVLQKRIYELTSCYFNNYNTDLYNLNSEEKKVLNAATNKLNLLYIQLGKLLDKNGLKKMGIYTLYDLNIYFNGFIMVIYNIYDYLKKWYCNYYHINIDYINVNMDTDIYSFYSSLILKKKEYYYEILTNEVLKYQDNKWYIYLTHDFRKLIDEYINNYQIIDSNIIKKFNKNIIDLVNYYNRNYKEDIIDLKRLKLLHIISEEDYGYLENYAGLWSYYKVREEVLNKSIFYKLNKKVKSLVLKQTIC